MKTSIRAALLAVSLCGTALAAQAQPVGPPAERINGTALNISAFGEVRTAPDMATVMLGVMTQGPTADEAMRANAARMNQVLAALRRVGIAQADIQTSGVNLNPQYVYEQNQPPRLNGYQANNQVSVRVMDIAKVGAALDAAISAGGNEVQGISFGLRDPAAAEDEARRRAVRALQAKAGLYAQATSSRVGRLVSLSEGGGYQPPPPRPIAMVAAQRMKEDSTPVAGGELSVRIDVSAVYELVR
jgi:uncharacterized protein YggE